MTSPLPSSASKTLVNGTDMDASAGGFRHQLPQIAVMSRSTKIAQSKTSAKDIISIETKSTTEVEGVGKVVHIGSEMMEIDDSEKKLLDELESSIAENEENIDSTNTNESQDVSDKGDGEKAKESAKDPIKPDSITQTEDSPDELETENQKTVLDNNKKAAENTETNRLSVNTEKEQTSATKTKPREKRKSLLSAENSKPKNKDNKDVDKSEMKEAECGKNEKSEASAKAQAPATKAKRGRRTASIEPLNVDIASAAKAESGGVKSGDDEPGSPSGKRRRKPKKLDIETEVPKSPPPTKEKPLKQPKPDLSSSITDKFPVQYMVGDLVWSKVTGHPWWPCMISYDPFTGQYTRVIAKKGREYHVQFFGEAAERGWITTHNLLEFQGKANFEEYVKGLLDKAVSTKEKQRLRKWYCVPPSRAKAVEIGIAAAELALPLSKNERKAQYTFVYKLPKSKVKSADLAEDVKLIKEAEKAKNKTSAESISPPAKKRKHEEVSSPASTKAAAKRRKIESPKQGSPTKSPKKAAMKRVSGVTEASFEVFCQKERDSVLAEHADFTDDQLLDYCRQQWCMMSQKQKARYKSRYNADVPVSPSRNRKPSKKAIEAEEGNRALDEVLSDRKPTATPGTSKGRKSATGTPKGSKTQKPTTDADTPKTEVKSAKRRGRPSSQEKVKEETTAVKKEESDSADSQDLKSIPTKTSTLIPAKRGRPRKSVSVESDSQSEKQSESGRSTPTSETGQPPAPKKVKEEFEYVMEIHKLSAVAPQKKENLCQVCEQTGELLECTGPCQGYFHTDCLGFPADAATAQFKCDECLSGNHTCFQCKKVDSATQRCTVPVCGKFYHVECVRGLPQAKVEGKGLTCPLHACHTCLAHNLKASATKTNGRLLRCVRCPTAYHVGDFCISAGSINLTGFNIVCAKHFQPLASQKHHSHVNVSWCFSCNKGGTLLCCESCPAAYHADCLKIEFPTGSWYCPDCIQGKRPLYGEIVWVKIGNYRWWPGEICHPRNVPVNIQEKAHQVGEFPVHFLGSHDYFWLHQGRVFSFQEGDRGNKNFSTAKGLARQFGKGLQEATDAYKTWKEFKDNREQLEIERESKKPAPFRMVKTNLPLGSVTIRKVDLSQIPRCECKPNQDHPCGTDSECLNHIMMIECHQALCNAGDRCENQFFTKRQYPSQQSYKTEGRGWGLMALDDIKKGQFVNEYVGDLIDEEECKKRLAKAHEDDVSNYYMMTLDQDRIIDAGPKGNLSRFMNHSCDPNLETQKWNVNGDVRVGLFALCDIKKGEELTFNYNFDCLGNEQTKCCCGSDNCSGYLGVRPKSQAGNGADVKKKDTKVSGKMKKKKKQQSVKRKHEDDCFRCGEGGELVMCDRTSCPKSYHLQCLGLDKPPHGKWDCPWHHCDECGKPAQQKCVECPNSFCTPHAEGNVQSFDNKIYCPDHEDLLQTLAESQSSATSDEVSDSEQEDKDVDKDKSAAAECSKGKKEQGSKVTTKEETLPPKKRGPKTSVSSDKGSGKSGGSGGKLVNGSSGKGSKGKKSSKGTNLTKELSDDLTYVAPMFDDSEDEEFGLVIDIPNF